MMIEPNDESHHSTATPLLQVHDLRTHFASRGRDRSSVLRAVDGVSLDLHREETLGLVGESGCGKSTLARSILNLIPVTTGRVVFEGSNILGMRGRRAHTVRRSMQAIFQDPGGSLNPRMTVGASIGEPLRVHRLARGRSLRRRVDELLIQVGLQPRDADRYPHEFSGGQRQRICLARALATDPSLIICDEPVSALDVSVQAQILELMHGLQVRLNLSYLFIAHNLAVVRHFCHRVAVMYRGRVVEIGPSQQVLDSPLHPYTEALLSAVPDPTPFGHLSHAFPQVRPVRTVPTSGCAYQDHCPLTDGRCRSDDPSLVATDSDAGIRKVACHHSDQTEETRKTAR